MKKLRLRMSFTLNAALIYVALFCVSTFALMEHASIHTAFFSYIKMPLMYVGGICLVTQIKTIFRHILKKNYFYTLLALVLLCVLLGVSTLINDSSIMVVVRLMLFLLELFLLMIVLAETGRAQGAINFLFWYVLILVLINDLLMFTRVITFQSGRFEIYLVGTKFNVAYLHMDLVTLWLMRAKRDLRAFRGAKWKVLLAAAYIIAVSIRVDIMTGIVGCLVLVCLYALTESGVSRRMFRLTSPWMLFLLLAASVAFVFAAEAILEIPAVRYVVEDLLGRSKNLTGRVNIYKEYIANMEGLWVTGVGYGNGNAASVSLFGYENAQNGILQWVMQTGVFATGMLVVLLLQVFRQIPGRGGRNMERIMPLVALIYTFVILGMIEVTFDMSFLLWFGMIFMLSNERKKLPQPEGVAVTSSAGRMERRR